MYGIKSRSGRIDRNATTFRFFPLNPRARAIRRPTPRWESVFTICFYPEFSFAFILTLYFLFPIIFTFYIPGKIRFLLNSFLVKLASYSICFLLNLFLVKLDSYSICFLLNLFPIQFVSFMLLSNTLHYKRLPDSQVCFYKNIT